MNDTGYARTAFWKKVYRSFYEKGIRSFAKAGYRTEAGQSMRAELLRKLLSRVKLSDDAAILDVGCSLGFVSEAAFRDARAKIIGVDIIEEPLREIRPSAGKKIKPCAADAQRLPFKDNTFELIIAVEVLQYLDSAEDFFRETRRVLKGRGYLAIIAPNSRSLTWFVKSALGRVHPMFLTYDCGYVIKRLKESGFEVISCGGVPASFMRFLSSPARLLGATFLFHSFGLLLELSKEGHKCA